MAHLLGGWGLHLAYDATRSVASQKMRPIFWLLFPSFLTQEEDLLWREDLLSSFERHNNGLLATRVAGQLTTKDASLQCNALQSPQIYNDERFVFF